MKTMKYTLFALIPDTFMFNIFIISVKLSSIDIDYRL